MIPAGHPIMKTSGFLIVMVGWLLAACHKDEPAANPANAPSASGNPVTAPVDYLGAVAKDKKAADKTIETIGLNQTIQLFYAQEGRFPKNLNELVAPGYLSKLPAPPAGMKFDYNPAAGQLKVVPQ